MATRETEFGPTWTPNALEKKALFEAAALSARAPVCCISLNPGNRHRPVDPSSEISFNILLVSESADPAKCAEDTDLWDTTTWDMFCKGVELTSDGCAVVDFYIRPNGRASRELQEDGLLGNVVVVYAEGRIQRIHETGTTGPDLLPRLSTKPFTLG